MLSSYRLFELLSFLIVMWEVDGKVDKCDGDSGNGVDSSSSTNMWSSMLDWKNSLDTLVGYVDSFAQEDCHELKCDGELVLRDGYSGIPDGCGSFGYNVDRYVAPGMSECCNEHDRCFSRCAVKKSECDTAFKKCLYDTCRKKPQSEMSLRVCQISAKFLYGATTLAGCSSFHQAQKSACKCRRKNGKNGNHYRTDL